MGTALKHKLDRASAGFKRLVEDVQAQLAVLSGQDDIEDDLARYIVIMLSQGKERSEIEAELDDLLGDMSKQLMSWTFEQCEAHPERYFESAEEPAAPGTAAHKQAGAASDDVDAAADGKDGQGYEEEDYEDDHEAEQQQQEEEEEEQQEEQQEGDEQAGVQQEAGTSSPAKRPAAADGDKEHTPNKRKREAIKFSLPPGPADTPAPAPARRLASVVEVAPRRSRSPPSLARGDSDRHRKEQQQRQERQNQQERQQQQRRRSRSRSRSPQGRAAPRERQEQQQERQGARAAAAEGAPRTRPARRPGVGGLLGGLSVLLGKALQEATGANDAAGGTAAKAPPRARLVRQASKPKVASAVQVVEEKQQPQQPEQPRMSVFARLSGTKAAATAAPPSQARDQGPGARLQSQVSAAGPADAPSAKASVLERLDMSSKGQQQQEQQQQQRQKPQQQRPQPLQQQQPIQQRSQANAASASGRAASADERPAKAARTTAAARPGAATAPAPGSSTANGTAAHAVAAAPKPAARQGCGTAAVARTGSTGSAGAADDASLQAAAKRDRELQAEMAKLRAAIAAKQAAKADPAAAAEQAKQDEMDARSVVVTNVPKNTTAEIMHKHFQKCGKLRGVTFLPGYHGPTQTRSVVVECMDAAAANRALGFSGTLIMKQPPPIQVHEKKLWDAANRPKSHALKRPGLVPLQKNNTWMRGSLVAVPGAGVAGTPAASGMDASDADADADWHIQE